MEIMLRFGSDRKSKVKQCRGLKSLHYVQGKEQQSPTHNVEKRLQFSASRLFCHDGFFSEMIGELIESFN